MVIFYGLRVEMVVRDGLWATVNLTAELALQVFKLILGTRLTPLTWSRFRVRFENLLNFYSASHS